MPIQFTATPRRSASLSIGANPRTRFSVGTKVDWDSLFNVPSAITDFGDLASTGLLASTTTDGDLTTRTLQAPAAGLTITNPGGVAGEPTFALANDLAALEAMSSTGIVTRTASETYAQRTITGTANEVSVANGDGVSGNPTVSLPSSMTFTGKTVIGGTYNTVTAFGVRSSGAAFDLQIGSTEVLTGNRLLSINLSDGNRTFRLSGNISFLGSSAVSFTSTGTTTLTLPTTGTLATTADLTAGYQPLDADLTAYAANSTDGFWAHTGAGTGAARTLTAPAAGLTISNPAGIAGNPSFALANDLAALEGLAANGIVTRTATDTMAVRTITGTAAEITVTNGDGVSGNPTLSLPAALTFTGKTVTGGTFTGITDIAVVDGGTGASSAATALSNLTARGQGKETIWIPASAMVANTTNGPSTGTTEQTTNKNMTKTLDFDTTTSESAQFSIALPKSYNNSTVTFQPYWTAASGSGTVIFALNGVAISDDDTLDVAFGTSQTSSDTLITALDCHVGPESSAITIAGTPASGDLFNFKIARDISDTLGVDAKLIGIKLYFTTNAVTDA